MNKLYTVIKVLAPIGIILAIYLLWQQFYQPAFKPCYVNSLINCDAVITGPVAKTLGLPTPLYGLIGYSVIFIAAIFKMKKLMLSMATFGLLFCLYIAYIELVILRVICPICIICQVNMLTIFILSGIIYFKKKTD